LPDAVDGIGGDLKVITAAPVMTERAVMQIGTGASVGRIEYAPGGLNAVDKERWNAALGNARGFDASEQPQAERLDRATSPPETGASPPSTAATALPGVDISNLLQQPWQAIYGGLLPSGRPLWLGQDPYDRPITDSEKRIVLEAAVEAQKRTAKTVKLILGPWDKEMIEISRKVFGFGPRGPSKEIKTLLATQYKMIADGLLGPLRVNLCRSKRMMGAAAVALPNGNVQSDMFLSREYIGDARNARMVSWTLGHELGHCKLHSLDRGYIDMIDFFDHGEIRYYRGEPALDNPDSLCAFAWAITSRRRSRPRA
jgi:hypothetical protein